jgi:hypothetical protein
MKMPTLSAKFVGNTKKMEDANGKGHTPSPKKVIFWRIKIGEDAAGNITAGYSGVATMDMASSKDITKILQQTVDGILPQTWKAPQKAGHKSPMFIQNNEEAHMVFVVNSGNYEFSENSEPFQVEVGKDDFLLKPRCSWRAADGTFHCERKLPRGERCRVASFIADSDDDLATGGGISFQTSFNIYLDLRLPSDNPGGVLLIPIAIDPDVGYPEGTHPVPATDA